jgi:hypothetical protein
LYVDDIVLTASSTRLLDRITASLHSEFAMTNMGSLHYFLMTHKYRGSQQSSREVKPKFIDSTQGEPKNIYKP